MKKTFKCALCEGTFPCPPEDIWNHDQALAEYKELYPQYEYDPKKVALTCDNCHEIIQQWRLHNEGHKTIQ